MNTNNQIPYGFTLVTSKHDHRIEAEGFHPDAAHMVLYVNSIDRILTLRTAEQSEGYKLAQEAGPESLNVYVTNNPDKVLDESGLVTKLLAEHPTMPQNLQGSLRHKYNIAQSDVDKALAAYAKVE